MIASGISEGGARSSGTARKRLRAALPATLLVVGLLAPGTAGVAEAHGSSSGSETEQAPSSHGAAGRQESEAADVALLAAAHGTGVADAQRLRAIAERFGAVQAQVAQQRPDAYAGARLGSPPGSRPALYLKGAADEQIRRIVAGAGIDIAVVEGRQYSYAELEERSIRLNRALAALGYRDIATSFDEATQALEATVTRRAGLPASVEVLRALLPAELGRGADLRLVDAAVGTDEHAYGGMWVRDSGTRLCTSGWSVISGSTTGVTTAGHCTGIDEIEEPGVGVHDLDHQAEHRGAFGDVEWKTSPSHIEPAEFYASASDQRQVNAVEPRASITVGEPICVYGRASNSRDCSLEVFRTSVSCTVSGVFNDRLVAMNSAVTTGGDSGGGWSFGTTAYGGHKGRCTFDGATRNVFSVADLFDEALGVTVRTQ